MPIDHEDAQKRDGNPEPLACGSERAHRGLDDVGLLGSPPLSVRGRCSLHTRQGSADRLTVSGNVVAPRIGAQLLLEANRVAFSKEGREPDRRLAIDGHIRDEVTDEVRAAGAGLNAGRQIVAVGDPVGAEHALADSSDLVGWELWRVRRGCRHPVRRCWLVPVEVAGFVGASRHAGPGADAQVLVDKDTPCSVLVVALTGQTFRHGGFWHIWHITGMKNSSPDSSCHDKVRIQVCSGGSPWRSWQAATHLRSPLHALRSTTLHH